jgi:hypothetical protein
MSSLHDREEFKRGRIGERIVALIMRSCGYFVIPSYDYGGSDGNKSPKMQGPKLALVIPDLDVVRGGKRHWVEVKTKDHADFTRMTDQLEHGIDLRHFEHYQRVESESGCDVVVSVFEESTGDVLASTLRRIAKAGRLSPRFNCGRGGYFWPRSVMTQIASVSHSGAVYDICVLARLAANPGFRWIPIREDFEGLKFRVTDRPQASLVAS